MSHEVETMCYTKLSERDVPWHGLGVPIPRLMTSDEALEYSGCAFRVKPMQAYFEIEDGVFDIVPATVVNVRETDNRVLGVVSDRYKIVQNVDAFAFVNHLVGKKKEDAHITTAGVLFGGRRIFLCAEMKAVTVLGDTIDPYIVFTNSHDGSTAVTAAITPIRVVCNNTLTMAIDGAKRIWSTHHTGDIEAKIEEAKETLTLYQKYMKEFPNEANKMVESELTKDVIEEFLTELFPIPEDAGKQTLGNIERKKNTLMAIYETEENIAQFQGTSWGMWNSVAAFTAHVKPIKETAGYRERLFADMVDGEGGAALVANAQKILAKVC